MRSLIVAVGAALLVAGCSRPAPSGAASGGAQPPAAAATGDAGAAASGPAAAQPPHIGQFACYGSGGSLLIGLGHVLKADGTYQNLDGGNGGRWSYDPGAATIAFTGGFMDGQVGHGVDAGGYQISDGIHCEPWQS